MRCPNCNCETYNFTNGKCVNCEDKYTLPLTPEPVLSRRDTFALEIYKAYASRARDTQNRTCYQSNADIAVESADALIARLAK